jgi:hypothetical protein
MYLETRGQMNTKALLSAKSIIDEIIYRKGTLKDMAFNLDLQNEYRETSIPDWLP